MTNDARPEAKDQGKSEHHLIEVRRGKAARIRERGENPFANDVVAGELPLTDLRDVRASFDGVRGEDGRYIAETVLPTAFRVAGRVLFVRGLNARLECGRRGEAAGAELRWRAKTKAKGSSSSSSSKDEL